MMNNCAFTTGKGNVSESRILAAYVGAGFIVLLPFGGGAPYDLIVDTGIRLVKVQVKTGRLRNGCILFPTLRFSGHNGKGRRYISGEFDVFAVYCPDNEQIFIVPLGENPADGRLRCFDTRNNQQQKVRWAKDFAFDDHVKELRREVELVGLEPTASTLPV
jgi:PD-(D/E)XK endonuclease